MITALIVYASIAIGVSFFCSVAEAVLLSITPSFIANLKKEKSGSAHLLADLKDNIERPLAGILSLNTIAHTVGAAGVGASAAEIWGSEVLGIASAIMTIAILVLSEIIPKTIGAMYWRQLAGIMGLSIKFLMFAMYPFVLISEWLTKLLSRGEQQAIVTRAEVEAMAELGVADGAIQGQESKILQNLFRFARFRVGEIMTPRTVLIAFECGQNVSDVLRNHPNLPVSRIPVYQDSIDNVIGYVLKTDLLIEAAGKHESDQLIDNFLRPIKHVRQEDSLPHLLDLLMDGREHIALVTGEYGGTSGIVTMEDLLETLLGSEIVDEVDEVEDMRALAKQIFERRTDASPKPEADK